MWPNMAARGWLPSRPPTETRGNCFGGNFLDGKEKIFNRYAPKLKAQHR
jgi:hypothetical protein